jgi:phosphatidylglycerophosphatase A
LSAANSRDMIILVTPDRRFLLAHPAHLIAFGFGSGLARVAPGTFGTLLGWLSFNLLATQVHSLLVWIVLLLASFAVGVWACEITGRDLGVADHGGMVWDEILAIWIVLLLVPATFAWQLAAFVAFRFFDILKPLPIKTFERAFKNGFGVMGDDLIAAFYALLVLAVFSSVWSRW